MKVYEKKKLKFVSKDTDDKIFKQINDKAAKYFAAEKTTRRGNIYLWLKFISLLLGLACSYYFIIQSHTFLTLSISYLLFGFTFLLIGINIGHDAAHHCVTGKVKADNILFNLIFGLQGINGYLWQLKHNYSHHIFPNVKHNDTDLDFPPIILISPDQKVRWYHKYQHLYAPFIYMFFSFGWIFLVDFISFTKKEHGNMTFIKIPIIEWVKFFLYKAGYLVLFIFAPAYFSTFSIGQIALAFLIMNMILSLFLCFTFFISHHVSEVNYIDSDETRHLVNDSWVSHQIQTTIDFNPNSPIANYIFGGFNLHIAHHLFPNVSHIHYPALTKIIKETLEEHNAHWYKSFTFFKGVKSHLQHLKYSAQEIMNTQPPTEKFVDTVHN